MSSARSRWPMLGTVVAVTVAIFLRLALAYRPVMEALDPTTVTWGASMCTAVIASGLTTLGVLPSIHRVARKLEIAPEASEPVDQADDVAPAAAKWRPPAD